jgi:hypothetical protein
VGTEAAAGAAAAWVGTGTDIAPGRFRSRALGKRKPGSPGLTALRCRSAIVVDAELQRASKAHVPSYMPSSAA